MKKSLFFLGILLILISCNEDNEISSNNRKILFDGTVTYKIDESISYDERLIYNSEGLIEGVYNFPNVYYSEYEKFLKDTIINFRNFKINNQYVFIPNVNNSYDTIPILIENDIIYMDIPDSNIKYKMFDFKNEKLVLTSYFLYHSTFFWNHTIITSLSSNIENSLLDDFEKFKDSLDSEEDILIYITQFNMYVKI